MPAAPKSPKKSAGAPKGKGAVRAKSGCYTCRIRRKKCDERPNEDNHCETCVRLRLECLGFGTKRPDWLRDNRNVLAVRDRIKTHLAAQGMIKGHSGAGPRVAEREPPVLRLLEEYPPGTSASASPPTPTLSISSSDDNRRPGLSISSMRDEYSTSLPPHLDPYHNGLPPPRIQELSPNSPVQNPRGPRYRDDIMLPPYTSLETAADGWQGMDFPPSAQGDPGTTCYPPADFASRAIETTLSPSYAQLWRFDDELDFDARPMVVTEALQLEQIPIGINYRTLFGLSPEDDDLMQHYLRHVMPIQYLLVDNKSIEGFAIDTMHTSPTALEAMRLLSSLHRHAMGAGAPLAHPDSIQDFNSLRNQLVNKRQLDEGDAMAALHIISWVLFRGGRGQWQQCLMVAWKFSEKVLYSPEYMGPQNALLYCSPSMRFIVKTSMWFDVLASATRVEVPRFLDVFRELFDPSNAHIAGASIDDVPEELSMLSIMGCENHIVWALAEISNLAVWKDIQIANGSLSTFELLKKGMRIEEYIKTPRMGHMFTTSNHLQESRLLTSEVFRASARVYLHSVISGDHPHCKEIMEAVAETIECLRRVPTSGTRSVVRSVVFSICICGCLTDDPTQRRFLLEKLDSQQSESVGNCAEVKELMCQVWRNRESSNGTVTWRDVMRRTEMLLV